MKYVEAPQELVHGPGIFLAGGITGCRDWQAELVEKLTDVKATLYNPRREEFPMDDPSAAEEQITWEYYALNGSDCVSFWFCRETICPIVLFELGACMERDQDFIVGMDPDYQRRQDVEIQVGLRHPGKTINLTLDQQAQSIRDFVLLFDN